MKESTFARAVLACPITLGMLLATGAVPVARSQAVVSSQAGSHPGVRATFDGPVPAGAATTSALFAHVALGGGYTTVFSLLNTGTDNLTGRLILTGSNGVPLDATLSSPSGPGEGAPREHATSVDILIPPAGIQIIEAAALSESEPTKTGWARVESEGGALSGVATFQQEEGGELKTIAGVLASPPVTVVTIPVNDDGSRERFTGFAVANPGSSDLSVKIVVVDPDGTPLRTLNPPELNPLGPGKQAARFLFQLLQDAGSPNLQFKGSMVMIAQGGALFSVVALIQDSGLFTAIPVIPTKAPHIN